MNTIDDLPELELLPNWGISFTGATKENLEARIQKQIEAYYSQNEEFAIYNEFL